MLKFTIIIILLLVSVRSFSQTPEYELKIKNIRYYGCPAKSIEFDIFIFHTDTISFEYAGGQFYFNFNKEITDGNIELSMVSSDLPKDLQGRTTTVSGDRMGVSTNLPPGPGKGKVIPYDTLNGVRIYTLRMTTNSVFNDAPLNLDWRTKGFNPYTKIAIYKNDLPVEIKAKSFNADSDAEIICDRKE